MGWTVPWDSSFGGDFNCDFHVTTDEAIVPVEYSCQDKAVLQQTGQSYHFAGEQPGLSVFLRDGDRVFDAHSTCARGLEPLPGIQGRPAGER